MIRPLTGTRVMKNCKLREKTGKWINIVKWFWSGSLVKQRRVVLAKNTNKNHTSAGSAVNCKDVYL